MRDRGWVPALGRWRAAPIYERIMRGLSLADLPGLVAEDLELRPGMRVLDIGCGPGSLAREVLSRQPAALVFGVDADRQMLHYAKPGAGARAFWSHGFAQALPLADESFDCAAMTLLLHHLTRAQKEFALAEAMRVLRPGGRLLVTDWMAPKGGGKLGFLLVRALDGLAQTADHAHGRLERLLSAAGVEKLRKARTRNLWLGTIAHFTGTKPAGRGAWQTHSPRDTMKPR